MTAHPPASPPKVDGTEELTSTMKGSHIVQTNSRLLLLPAELRNRIYEFALVEDTPIAVPTYKAADTDQAFDASVAALTRSCHQIRNESLKLFYELNCFQIECIRDRELPLIDDYVKMMQRVKFVGYFCSHDDNSFYLDVSDGVKKYMLNLEGAYPYNCSCLRYLRRGQIFLNACFGIAFAGLELEQIEQCTFLTKKILGKLIKIFLGLEPW